MSTVAPHVSQLLFCASVRGGEEIKARGEFVLLSPSPHTPTPHPFSTPPPCQSTIVIGRIINCFSCDGGSTGHRITGDNRPLMGLVPGLFVPGDARRGCST